MLILNFSSGLFSCWSTNLKQIPLVCILVFDYPYISVQPIIFYLLLFHVTILVTWLYTCYLLGRHEHRLGFYFVFISKPPSFLQHTFSKSWTSSASSLKSHKACRISTFVRNGRNWKSMSVLKGLSRPYSWKMLPLLLMFQEHYITKFLLLNSFIKIALVFTNSLVKLW